VSNLIRLLELPDEVLQMLERNELSEGHGRALLLADDHAARRSIAQQAVREGWSVRQVEARAAGMRRDGGSRKRRRQRELHPDQAEGIEQITDTLGDLAGDETTVSATSSGGYRVQLTFDSLDAALDFARRLRVRRAA
jgi:ParB family chromosome partitioning protein